MCSVPVHVRYPPYFAVVRILSCIPLFDCKNNCSYAIPPPPKKKIADAGGLCLKFELNKGKCQKTGKKRSIKKMEASR
jgi:hypothetical protein